MLWCVYVQVVKEWRETASSGKGLQGIVYGHTSQSNCGVDGKDTHENEMRLGLFICSPHHDSSCLHGFPLCAVCNALKERTLE